MDETYQIYQYRHSFSKFILHLYKNTKMSNFTLLREVDLQRQI